MQPSRKKQKSTAAPETDEDLLRKKFKCVKCSVQLQDVKLLKLHFWKVHIQQNEIINHMNVDDKYLVKTTFKKKTPTKFESKKRKRMADVEDNSDSENVDNTSANVSLTEEEKLIDKVNKLTGDEIRWFNLTQTQINEQEIADFYQPMDESAQFNKIKELEQGKIVWAKYGKLMWPARVEKLIRTGKTNVIQKVSLRYFEANQKMSYVFKLEPSKIELFFRSVEKHYINKEKNCEKSEKRFEFLSAYSDALEEYHSLLNSEQSTNKVELISEKSEHSEACDNEWNMHYVNDQLLSVEEITSLAVAPITENQIEVNKERFENSHQLYAVLESKECQKYVIDILTNQIGCERNTTYLGGNNAVRKEMKFESPGPLVTEHQTALVKLLLSLQKEYFPEKPANLRDYEYDVLYPEAVIWAIQKLDSCSVRKAELKYTTGFKQTIEESTKQRCNEILVRLKEKERIEKEQRRMMTETRPIEESDKESIGPDLSTFLKTSKKLDYEDYEADERAEVRLTLNSIVDTVDNIGQNQFQPELSNDSSGSLVDFNL